MEGTASAIISRDRALGTLLEEFGHAVKGFKTTEGRGGLVQSHDAYVDWTYYPLDQSRVQIPNSRVTSQALIEDLVAWSPDFLLVKGLGTAIGKDIVQRFDSPIGWIIGGNHKDKVLATSQVVFVEDIEQERFLRPRLGSGRLIRLPKLVSPIFSTNLDSGRREYDIVVVSKFERHKNIDALRPLFDQDVSMVFVGDGSLRYDIEQYAKGRPASATFTGFVPAHEVAHILRAARLLVHPSLSEGFPRVVVEGMASGTPAVCLEGVVGWPLVNRYNGLLVSQANLVESTIRLLGDPDELETLQSGAIETFQREFTIESLRKAARTANTRMVEALEGFEGHGGWRERAAIVRYALADVPRRGFLTVRRVAKTTIARSRREE